MGANQPRIRGRLLAARLVMDLNLKDKVVVVAGSSRGIGKTIAGLLLEEGAKVCISGRDPESLAATEHEFSNLGQVAGFRGDLAKAEPIALLFKFIGTKWGALDAIIVNLGTGRGTSGWDPPEEDWDRLFLQNFHAGRRLAGAAVPLLERRGGGSIVFISSITGVEATPAPLPYSAAKAALINYSKNLSRQLAEKNIRVNCIAPGNIVFPGGSWDRRLIADRESVTRMLDAEVPLKRLGTPGEIAGLAAFLCSTQASFITGACMVADGGQTKRP